MCKTTDWANLVHLCPESPRHAEIFLKPSLIASISTSWPTMETPHILLSIFRLTGMIELTMRVSVSRVKCSQMFAVSKGRCRTRTSLYVCQFHFYISIVGYNGWFLTRYRSCCFLLTSQLTRVFNIFQLCSIAGCFFDIRCFCQDSWYTCSIPAVGPARWTLQKHLETKKTPYLWCVTL